MYIKISTMFTSRHRAVSSPSRGKSPPLWINRPTTFKLLSLIALVESWRWILAPVREVQIEEAPRCQSNGGCIQATSSL
jgi:hypothetical protein